MASFTFQIPTTPTNRSAITVDTGQLLFIVGANGTGKSALVHNMFLQHRQNAFIILAQRPVWLSENSAVMSASDLKRSEDQIQHEISQAGRTQATQYNLRRKISLIKLAQMQNANDRELAEAFRSGNITKAEELKQKPSPFQIINQIFKSANLNIVISVDDSGAFFASRDCSPLYSITEMSDGEKNAFMLCAEVLTAKRNTLFIFDEPERHLHQAIIVPLINSLLECRRDCAFLIATHDLHLPASNPTASVILLREVNKIQDTFHWTFDDVVGSSTIPDDIKTQILGARRKVVFVEGGSTSRDKNLYQLLFPSISVECKESCLKVERAVEGVRGNPSMNWVEAFGIIDADDRTPAQIAGLEARGVYAVPAYSVEYLYYNPGTVQAAAEYYAAVIGKDANTLFNASQANIITNIRAHSERLCARVCEKRIGEKISRLRPTWVQIQQGHVVSVTENTGIILSAEIAHFDGLIAANNIDELLARYPFRETPVITGIVAALKISASNYEQIVRKMVLDEKPLKADLLAKLGNIVAAITPPPPVPVTMSASAPLDPAPIAVNPIAT